MLCRSAPVARVPTLRNLIVLSCLFWTAAALAQQPGAAARSYANRCAICHAGDGVGTDRAPSILGFIGSHSDAEIASLVRTGRLDQGMPRFDFNDAEMTTLLAHLRSLVAGTIQTPPPGGR